MNANGDVVPLSRTTSVSRTSKAGSTLSRNHSLIKKNIELQDLKPADVLIERFVAWKAIVSQLIAYFEGIADIENNTAKEMTKLASLIQVPFRSGNQFLGEGGLQDVFFGIRDKTRIIADQQADLGRTIDSSIVQHLQKLRTEIKAHIKNVQMDTGKLATGVAKEREISTKLIGDLANGISSFKNTPMHVTSRTDPYVANQFVAHQLHRQVLEENLLQKSIVIMQQNSAHFEEGIVRSIQSAWHSFDEWQSRASISRQDIFRDVTAHLTSLAPDREWIAFAARCDHLLDPDTPLRDSAQITYPLKDDPSVIAVHTGYMERKKRFTRAYSESYFVLTPAGYLHEYPNSDPSVAGGKPPAFSIFLPNCTLGPPSSPNAKSNKFHIEGRKDGTGTTKSGSFRGLLGKDNMVAWSFRARSREDMLEWWHDIRMLCARYLVASEQIERTGPVEAAVRSVGYVSGEEEEMEEDEEESAEEDEAEGDEGIYQDADETLPPVYGHQRDSQSHGIEIGPNGYAVKQKNHPPADQYDAEEVTGLTVSSRVNQRRREKAPEDQHARNERQDTSLEVDGEHDGVAMDHDARPSSGVNVDNVEEPHVTDSNEAHDAYPVAMETAAEREASRSGSADVPGPAPADSRFQENL